ncbi:MAG: roadblock/LC7 domain-containing protein, partial [Candidatus Thorarchaeota archaeon]
MSDPKIFDKILTEIIRQDKGIKKVILVDKTGLTIANVSKLSYYPVDVDSIGAIASAVFCASEEQGKNLQIGELEIVTSEFSEGKIFASACGKGVLCVVSEAEVNIGLIRLVMKKQG